MFDPGLATRALQELPAGAVGEQEQPVILGEDLEEAPEWDVGGEQEQAKPMGGRPLHGLGPDAVPYPQYDGGGAGGGHGLQEVFVERLAVRHGHLVGGDPALHRLVDGEPAHPPGCVAGQRAVGPQLL
jgi:hypothetical protein